MMIRLDLDSIVVVVVRGASLGNPARFMIPLRPTAPTIHLPLHFPLLLLSLPPHSSYHTSPSPGVMSVAELVRQSGRDYLPYLTPYPYGRGQTWFNRSGNGISAWINRMMYSVLDKGHLTFTDFLTEKQHLWFRQFAEMNPRKFPTNISSEYTEGLLPRNIPRDPFLGIFRGLLSSEISDENSEERFLGTSKDWTIGKSIEIYRGSFPSVYSEELSDELVVLGVSSEIHFLGIPSEIFEGFSRKNEFPRSYFR
uniref:Uncharacterized protein n=1 Tax=Brassica oleracea var. oleracea TaxID=109376 RepID=A0A0D3BLR6_BRAOL